MSKPPANPSPPKRPPLPRRPPNQPNPRPVTPSLADDWMKIADAVREPKSPACPSRGGVAAVVPMGAQDGPVSSRHGGREEPVVAADSEGRAGGDQSAPGAVPFTLPPTPPAWRRS